MTSVLSRPRIEADPVRVPIEPARRFRRWAAGRSGDPRWARPALVALLAATAVLYLWGLGASGWANSFYSAAVQAGTHSWKAFFFGSSDSANAITIDKPPAALWVMELSARVFGVNAWSILVPQALEGVAAVGLLHAAVRRWFSAGGALLAGAVLALTPVAALMFRFNNPDALLVLTLTAAAYAMVRAIEKSRTSWLIAASTLIGFGFLAKMLQAFLVVPAFGLAYLMAAPTSRRRRLVQLVAAGAALAASSLWWVVAVQMVPAANRPYIGGSQNNSLWNLIFGYNGFGRLTGNEAGSVTGGRTTGSPWGRTGWLRMFSSSFGGQGSWLLPAAVILLAGGLAFTWLAGRTDRTRAALVLWGGWLVVTAAVFSFGAGIIHPYYTVALAPAIGAVVGIGATTMWSRRESRTARLVLGAALAVTAVWAFIQLARTPNWYPWLRGTVLIGGVAAVVIIVSGIGLRGTISALVATTAIVVALAGPTAYTLATVSTAHRGAIPSAGPAAAGGFGPGGSPGRGLGAFRPGGGPAGLSLGGGGGTGRGANLPAIAAGQLPVGGPPGQRGGFGQGGGIGGLLNASTPSAPLVAALKQNSSRYTWVAATIGANEAAGYQLATSKPVMAMGGFNGTDPSPALAQFEQYVHEGRIHYFIPGGGGPGGGAATTSSQISSWVQSHYVSTTVGGVTLYDLTKPSA